LELAHKIFIVFPRIRQKLLEAMEPYMNPDFRFDFSRPGWKDTSDPSSRQTGSSEHKRIGSIQPYCLQQYLRRIVFHDPALYLASLGKVSAKDFLLDENLSVTDIFKMVVMLLRQQVGFGLLWMKDSMMEALVMARNGGNCANVGRPGNTLGVFPFISQLRYVCFRKSN
jgi:hypothetical protein